MNAGRRISRSVVLPALAMSMVVCATASWATEIRGAKTETEESLCRDAGTPKVTTSDPEIDGSSIGSSAFTLVAARLRRSHGTFTAEFIMQNPIPVGLAAPSDAEIRAAYGLALFNSKGRPLQNLEADALRGSVLVRNHAGERRTVRGAASVGSKREVGVEAANWNVVTLELPIARTAVKSLKRFRWAAYVTSIESHFDSPGFVITAEATCPGSFRGSLKQVDPSTVMAFPEGRTRSPGSGSSSAPSCDSKGLRAPVEQALASEVAPRLVEVLSIHCSGYFAAVDWTAAGFQGGLLLFEQQNNDWTLINDPFGIVLECDAQTFGISATQWSELGLDDLLPC